MQEQAKTATPTPSSTNNTTTTSSFVHLPKEVQQQILECLTSHELITGIGTSSRWLRNFCLPLVKEVHIVIPALQRASKIARMRGKEAGLALIPKILLEWREWVQRVGGKLANANGLLGRLPNVEVIHGWELERSLLEHFGGANLSTGWTALQIAGFRPQTRREISRACWDTCTCLCSHTGPCDGCGTAHHFPHKLTLKRKKRHHINCQHSLFIISKILPMSHNHTHTYIHPHTRTAQMAPPPPPPSSYLSSSSSSPPLPLFSPLSDNKVALGLTAVM